MNILQRLYDSEINFSISTFWDDGFEVKLGDGMNGFVAEANVQNFAEVKHWLTKQVERHYPNSLFVTGKKPPASAGSAAGQVGHRRPDQGRG